MVTKDIDNAPTEPIIRRLTVNGRECQDEVVEIASGYAIVKTDRARQPTIHWLLFEYPYPDDPMAWIAGIDVVTERLGAVALDSTDSFTSYSSDALFLSAASHKTGVMRNPYESHTNELSHEILRRLTARGVIDVTISVKNGVAKSVFERYGEKVSIEDTGDAQDVGQAMRDAIIFMVRSDWLR